MKVLKRNGTTEDLSVDKLNAVVLSACEGLDANPSDIIMNAKLQLFDGIKTTKIHELLVKSAIDLIDVKTSDYQFAASKLFSFYTRKQVFGSHIPEDFPTVKELVQQNIERGLYDPVLLEKWNDEEWETINAYINHDNDEKLSIASYLKLYDTYLAKDRKTGYVYETPQFAFMIVSLALYDDIKDVKGHYRQLVSRKLSWPTPVMAGMRTNTRQYASCTLIETKDTLDSLYSAGHAIGRFVSKKAGIGVKMNFRGVGDAIRGGEAVHTGNIGFLKHIQSATKSVSQGGLRDGSATVTYDIFHPEISDVLVLKNNKGTDDTRVKNLDYSIRLSKLFINRMLRDEVISLFSVKHAPELSEIFGTPEFDKVYESYEANNSIPRKTIQGKELLSSLVMERIQTGRIYLMFVDNVNGEYNAFKENIKMSNLCFSGDTMVAVADGRNAVSIQELAEESNHEIEFPVYSARESADGKSNRKTEIKNAVAFKSGTKEVVTVKLSNGDSFRCTPDHRIATKTAGEYVEAKDSVGLQIQEFFTYTPKVASSSYRLFNGDYEEFSRYCNNLEEYDDERKSKIKSLHSSVFVVDVEYNNEVIDVYDLTVEDNHNFYIINSTEDEKYLNCQGVLVHNCQEIVLPTEPFEDINKDDGEIALCMLGGYNLEHAVKDFSTIEESAKYLVKGLDNIMDIQDYPVLNSEKQKKRRSIGIGVTNFAYWMAKKGLSYNDPKSLPFIDELFEHIQFYTIKASMELAKERGACEWFHKTKYSEGWLPIDKINANVKEVTGNRELSCDWEWLRNEIKKYGLRNSVLTALMPVESSSLVTNSTNGINPPFSLVTYKTSKTMTAKFVVPGIKSLANKYTLAWDITSNDMINKIAGVMQYWVDQAISINHYYNPLLYADNKIPIDVVVKDIVTAWKYGNKNLYYANTMDAIQDDEVGSGCGDGGCTL